MAKQILRYSLALLIASGMLGRADAYTKFCGYGLPPATIPPSYSTLYCGAEIDAYDLLYGVALHQDTFVGAGTGQSILVIGVKTTTWAYHPALTKTLHWVRRGPTMPVGQYLISSEWTGLNSGGVYDGPRSESYTAPLGPPP